MKHSFPQTSENNTNESSSTQMDVETQETAGSATLFPILNLPEEVIVDVVIPQLDSKGILSFRGLSQSTKQIIDNYAHSHQQWQAIYTKNAVNFFINFKGEVYACGYNEDGQLGLGHNKTVNTLHEITFFKNKKVKQIKIGIDHTIFLTEDREVFVCGSNKYGQLGLENIEKTYTPMQLDFFKDIDIKTVIADAFKSIFISYDEQLYICGFNEDGQLGLGHCNNVKKPTQLDFFNHKLPKQIMMEDFDSTIFLTTEGQLYICGKNYGHTPVRIDLFKEKPLKEIILSSTHIFYITRDGPLFACGENRDGELGLGHTNEVEIPQQMNFFENKNLKQIILAGLRSFFLTEDGQAYACGLNNSGEFGLGHNINENTPRHITFFEDKPLQQIIANEFNTVFQTQDGRVYECGELSKKNIPTQIVFPNNKTIAQIQSGYDHAIFLTHDNQVFVYGRNYHGQLGLGHNNDVFIPQHISQFKDKSLQKLSMLVEEKISANKAEENISMDVIEEEKKPFRFRRLG